MIDVQNVLAVAVLPAVENLDSRVRFGFTFHLANGIVSVACATGAGAARLDALSTDLMDHHSLQCWPRAIGRQTADENLLGHILADILQLGEGSILWLGNQAIRCCWFCC